jgi:hypothetical protein
MTFYHALDEVIVYKHRVAINVKKNTYLVNKKNILITYVINYTSPYISLSKRCSNYDKIFSIGDKNRIEMIVGNKFTVTVVTSQKFVVHAIVIQRVGSLPKIMVI